MKIIDRIKNKGKLIMAVAKKKPVLKVKFDPTLQKAFDASDLEDKNPLHGYATKGSAGIDLKCAVDKRFRPNRTEMVRTGISVSIPVGYVGVLASRSGVGVKKGLSIAQGVGVIDSDYRGEVFVPLHNRNDFAEKIEFGERIAQLLIVPVVQPEIVIVDELDETERGEGGFGSTGK